MKVLLISHNQTNLAAGASSVVLNIARELRSIGLHVDEFHLNNAFTSKQIHSPRWRGLLFPYAVACTMAGKSGQYDVVDASGPSGWPLFDILRPKERRPALVMRSMGLEHLDDAELEVEAQLGNEEISWRYRLAHRGLRLREVSRAIESSDVMVCATGEEKAFTAKQGWKSPHEVHVTRWGLTPEFATVGQVSPKASRDFRVLWWGSWISRKGIAYVPRAISLAASLVPNLTLTLGGTGLSYQQVAARFPPEVRSRLSVLPYVSRAEQRIVFSHHDCFLFPSLSEGFGLAVLEAMASALPVVVTPTGIGSDLVRDGENGIVVPKRDAEAIAVALARLAETPAWRTRLGAAGRDVALGCTWRNAAEATVKAYEYALKKGSKVRSQPLES